MSKFFIDSKNISGDLVKITDKNEINHIVCARRFKEGNIIDLFDDKQNSYKGVINKITSSEIIINIVETRLIASLQASELTIACALPKNAKFDYIVEKLTELGVFRIIPMITDRTIVRLQPNKAKERVERFRKIAKEAAKQSSNPIIPIIDEIKNFKDIFKEKDFDLIMIPTLDGKRSAFSDIFGYVGTGPCACPKKILVLIGPEGDFSPKEIEFAIKEGAKPVSLGDRILKVDTAAIFVAAIINENI